MQLCGDAHVLNFGLWATPERQLSFDLRDFDETLPGPFEWDVMRLVASLRSSAVSQGMDMAAEGDRAVRAAQAGIGTRIADYADAGFLDIWYDSITAEDLVSVLRRRADQDDLSRRIRKNATKRLDHRGAAKKFTETVDGPPAACRGPARFGSRRR